MTLVQLEFSRLEYTISSGCWCITRTEVQKFKKLCSYRLSSYSHRRMKQLDWIPPPDDHNVANVWPWLWWLYIAAPNLTFVPVLLCPVSLVRLESGWSQAAPGSCLCIVDRGLKWVSSEQTCKWCMNMFRKLGMSLCKRMVNKYGQ